ncbi:hypothetical protein [Rhodoblastus sp.]|uniref:hypothetical protein n=1 Tax=Rhodoblastus sp. TaxID=1962975 RepID=UPI003F989C60
MALDEIDPLSRVETGKLQADRRIIAVTLIQEAPVTIPPGIEVIGTVADTITKIAKLAGVFKTLSAWIIVQPEAASAELAAIIDEVMKAPEVVNESVNKLLVLIDNRNPNLAALNAVGNGTLARQVERNRPHCQNIERIAHRHLWQWLEQSGVDGPNAQELRDALSQLADADERLFYELTEFARAIQRVARQAAKLAVKGQKDEALRLLADVTPSLFDAQLRANNLANELQRMQIAFRSRALGIAQR